MDPLVGREHRIAKVVIEGNVDSVARRRWEGRDGSHENESFHGKGYPYQALGVCGMAEGGG
jgi:hypothetical protein